MSKYSELIQAAEDYAIASSRSSVSAFVRYTMPSYTFGWFNELVCLELEKFYKDLEAGKMPRLMIFAPPRSGKSELASRRFPAWVLGKNPGYSIIACSNGADLASRMSRDCKRIVSEQKYRNVFPKTCINSKSVSVNSSSGAINTADLWELVNPNGKLHGGAYRSSGVGGSITGMGCQLGIIDDPVKDYQDASSKTKQKRNLEWYETTFSTRLDPLKNGVIIIQTRWHKNDLSGVLLKQMEDGGEKWRVVSFPMVATKDERHCIGSRAFNLRKKGEILFPERMPAKYVEKCKLRGAITWNALYQQSPKVAGGGVFKIDWFGRYLSLPKRFERVVITADTAQKAKEHNDYSVFQLWGKFENKIYLIDQIRGKWESPELLKRAGEFWKRSQARDFGPQVRVGAMHIEDKASGTGLIQQLRADGVPCVAIPRQIDKFTRATDASPYLQSGMVIIPETAPWRHDYLTEFEEFTADDTHGYDDQVDPTLDAIEILLGGGDTVNYSGWI